MIIFTAVFLCVNYLKKSSQFNLKKQICDAIIRYSVRQLFKYDLLFNKFVNYGNSTSVTLMFLWFYNLGDQSFEIDYNLVKAEGGRGGGGAAVLFSTSLKVFAYNF